MSENMKIKLLNGPISGREIPLPHGSLTLGAKDCDLLLPLETCSSITLEVNETGVMIGADVPCWVEGVRYLDKKIPLGKFIDLDGVCFVLGSQGETLSALKIVARRKSNSSTGLFLGLVLVMLMFIVLGGGVVVALGGGQPWDIRTNPNEERAVERNSEWVQESVSKVPGLQMRWLPNGVLELYGRCQSGFEIEALKAKLFDSNIHLQQSAICNDDLVNIVQSLFVEYGFGTMSVKIDNAGFATIEGSLQDNVRLPELVKALDNQSGITGWKIVNHDAGDFDTLIAELSRYDLLLGISMSRVPNGWIISGRLSNEQRKKMQELLHDLAKSPRHRRVHFIEADNVVNPQKYLPAPMLSLGGNEKETYVQLANGMRLQVGNAVLKGMRILAISRTGIALVDGQQLVFLPMNR